MPNERAKFITHYPGGGSSLYYVTAHWVIRCSGNSVDGRTPTTFIRERPMEYRDPETLALSRDPAIGWTPVDGGHEGDAIDFIIDGHLDPNEPPRDEDGSCWRDENGVTWATAVAEIEAAIDFAQANQWPRAARHVGTVDWQPEVRDLP